MQISPLTKLFCQLQQFSSPRKEFSMLTRLPHTRACFGASLLLLLCSVLPSPSPVAAQEQTPPSAVSRENESARINGKVADQSGADIVGVEILARNLDSGKQFTAMTSSDGTYAIQIEPGRYDVEIKARCFKPFHQNNVMITDSQSLAIDAVLELESQIESVTVLETETQMDPSSTQLGGEISEKRLSSIPLNGRSYTDLLSLQPGIAPTSTAQPNAVVMAGVTSTPPSGDLDAGNVSVSGQRETANGFMVNGSDVEEDVNMGTAVVPNLDSIEELRILTSNFEAQYGNYSGGQVLLTTKSGGDVFHGSAFEFFRNTGLDAKNYFSPDRAKFDRNQFGGTVGGPIKQQKAFFFVDYQGTRTNEGVETGLISVPSSQDRAGNLSDRTNDLTGTVSGNYLAAQLSQALGYTVSPGESYYTPGCTSSTQCVLPNATIPQSAWSAPAKSLLQYIPQANQGSNLFSSSAENETVRDDKGSLRFDLNSKWGTLSTYYFADDYWLDNPYPTGQGGANVPGFNASSHGLAQLLSFGLTRSFGSNSVNEIHASFMRNANVIGTPIGGVGPSLASQGFVTGAGTPGIVPLAPSIEGIANVSLNDLTFGVDITGLTQASNTFQVSENYTRIVGRHTLKLGGAFHRDQINTNPDSTLNGSFSFAGAETGLDFADFLLGIASSYTQADSRSFYPRNKYLGLYGQDSWRITPSLTLNFGLRWDLLPAWSEKYNQFQTLVLGEQSETYPGAPRGLLFPGDPGIPSTLAPTKYINLAPRLGIAYSPNAENGLLRALFGAPGKTSIRAGFGEFYTAFEGLSAGIMSANPPYGYSYTSLAPVIFSAPFIAAATGQQVKQPFPSPIPAYGASPSNPNTTVDWSSYDPITGVPSFFHQNVPPYAETYTLSVERQVADGTFLTVSYVGSQAHHLLALIPANPGNAALCLSVSEASEVAPGTPTCGPFSEGGTFTRTDGQSVVVRGPFGAQFDSVTYQKTIGNSNYNAFEASLRHRTKSIEFTAGYTYSKSLDDSSSLAEEMNPLNPSLSKALSAFDLRHNFVASYNYSLPVAHLLLRENRWTQGWAISGVTRFSTGLPVTLYNNNDTSLVGSIPNGINANGLDTPNVALGNLEINTDPRNGRSAFNTELFSLPSLGQMGTASRRFFDGPGMLNFDMALLKNTKLTESKLIQFRLEAFNTFNHAQFYGAASVSGNISSASFGQTVASMSPRLVQLSLKLLF
jgi:hypothetical protein